MVFALGGRLMVSFVRHEVYSYLSKTWLEAESGTNSLDKRLSLKKM